MASDEELAASVKNFAVLYKKSHPEFHSLERISKMLGSLFAGRKVEM